MTKGSANGADLLGAGKGDFGEHRPQSWGRSCDGHSAPAAGNTVTGRDDTRFADHLRGVENNSPRTADTYSGYARLFTTWLADTHPDIALADVTPAHIRAWLEAQEQRGVGGDARRVGVYALRAFYTWRTLDISGAVNPATQVRPPAQLKVRTDTYSDSETERILAHTAADTTLSGRFDHALLATLQRARHARRRRRPRSCTGGCPGGPWRCRYRWSRSGWSLPRSESL
ncbi:MAG TPA: site-specific integrase [Acidimicrobiales bacterium]|nr:site-specific integrase [Acidimicrobiales bacterium]